jgi:DNA-directed RNA polymerase subunit beta'
MEITTGKMTFHSLCWFWMAEMVADEDTRGRWLRTTAGRVLFNSIVPKELGFLNRTFGKKELGDLVFDCFTIAGLSRTTEFLDNLKDFGFRSATRGGISVGLVDLEIPE